MNFPARWQFDQWIGWGALASDAARHKPPPPESGPFAELRAKHVFVYAGPSCFYCRTGCVGDAAMYFEPGAEAGHQGGATPFDSGSLEDSPPRLQPFRSRNASEQERWDFFSRHQVSLDEWRSRFAAWLAHSYDAPDRYIESTPDRYAAGEPDRLRPASLLQHNGTRGRARYGEYKCGDRRAWTWEVRIEGRLPYERLKALHVPSYKWRKAREAAGRLQLRTHESPLIETLPHGVPGSADSLYEYSGALLTKLVGT